MIIIDTGTDNTFSGFGLTVCGLDGVQLLTVHAVFAAIRDGIRFADIVEQMGT